MKQKIDMRAPLLIALATAFAAPAFAQSAEPTQAQQDAPPEAAQPATDASKALRWSDLDKDKDGKLSKSEAQPVQSLSAVFDQADANADGALTGDEYKAYLAANTSGDAATPAKR
ncbi:MAG: EF-hand domain-containing protein [Xanthomonadales bacterium]|nr:EF-hand domain-containing protein [Xanthomonadales bacterium]